MAALSFLQAIESLRLFPVGAATTDTVGLGWLARVRWATLAAGVGAVVAGRQALNLEPPILVLAALFAVWAGSNIWLTRRLTQAGEGPSGALAGALVSFDVLVLSGLLFLSGGILNPASVFYLVLIVMAALVLGDAGRGS